MAPTDSCRLLSLSSCERRDFREIPGSGFLGTPLTGGDRSRTSFSSPRKSIHPKAQSTQPRALPKTNRFISFSSSLAPVLSLSDSTKSTSIWSEKYPACSSLSPGVRSPKGVTKLTLLPLLLPRRLPKRLCGLDVCHINTGENSSALYADSGSSYVAFTNEVLEERAASHA